jgi:hypothetical protein
VDKPVLSDPAIFPTEEVLFSHLGKAKPSFSLLFQFNHTNFPDFVERWKYYNDGKSWLLNVSRKKKTLFWLSVKDGSFRTTFYLNAKAAQRVPVSKIPQELKNQFKESEGKTFRGITVVIKTKKDVEVYKELLAIKMTTM